MEVLKMEYTNDVIKELITRRSCKSYTDQPVPQELIDQIVECGLHAANLLGKQLPVILVVTDPDTRNRLSALNAKYDRMKRPDPFYGAPVILSVLSPKADPGAVEDGSLVIGNMLLAAHSLGLGSCWIHRAKQVFDDPEGIEILKRVGLDDNYVGIGNMALGYARVQPDNIAPRREGRVFRI